MAFILYVLKSGSKISPAISSVMTFISFCASIYIISKKDKGSYKLTWVFMILLFPIFGGLFYIMFNFQLTYKRYAVRSAGEIFPFIIKIEPHTTTVKYISPSKNLFEV